MRLRRFWLGVAVSALALALTGSHAAPSTVRFQRAQGFTFSGKVHGGTATVSIVRLDGVALDGYNLTVLPAPKAPAPVVSLSGGPAGSALAGQVAGPQYVGCITVKTSAGTDSGCDVIPPTSLEVDPAMQSGTLSLGVRSRRDSHKQIVVSMILTGADTIGPASTDFIKPTPDTTRKRATIVAAPLLARTVGVAGSVRSQIVGGGSVLSTKKAQLFEGFSGYVMGDPTTLACPAQRCVP